ncbi:MAG: VOC family protein [Caldilineaceae bacterium]|nr:VOC family protein [Caldilineaceae bacterium]
MKLEHAALNVPEPGAMARWYAENLGLRIVVANDQGTYIHFLSDDGGSMIELYHNPVGEVLDFAAMSPFSLHLAFGTDDIAADHARLLAAGAHSVDEITTTPTGDQLVFLRDPWNVPIQLAQRAKPLA